MDTMKRGTHVHTTRDGREVRLHLAGVVEDLTIAGWKLGMSRERWLNPITPTNFPRCFNDSSDTSHRLERSWYGLW